MQATSERISSLCTSLGHNTPNGYVPSDDCQLNLNELAFSIWHDDEAAKNVCSQVYEFDVFKRDFIPLLLVGEPISYVALKALTAVTYLPSPNAEEYDKQMDILKQYKNEASFHPEIFAKVLEYTASIIENPRAEVQLLNRAELAMTFIRNIAIIPSSPDVHERIVQIFIDSYLFDVIENLKLIRFGDRSMKFARLLLGIFYGTFVPYLPLKKSDEPDKPSEQKPSSKFLRNFINSQKNVIHSSSRHGHWGGSVTVTGHGKSGYTMPINLSLSGKAPLPSGKHLPMRNRPIEKSSQTARFTKEAEQAAAKVISMSVFPLAFELGIPHAFAAYDKSCPANEQLQFCDTARFFIDFSLKYGAELKVKPLATSEFVSYVQSMAMFFISSNQMLIDGITSISALQTICRYYSSLSLFLNAIIRDDRHERQSELASEVVSKYSSDIENFLIDYLSQSNLTKKTLTMLKDNIVALDHLHQLYITAQENDLMKVSITQRDEDANPDDIADDRIIEDIRMFNSEMIVKRIIRRQNALTPFFIVLQNFEILEEEDIISITRILKQFIKKKNGLAHLFKLSYFYVINKLWNDGTVNNNENTSDAIKDLNEVFEEIVRHFFLTAMRDKTAFVSLIVGFDENDVYDEEAEKREKEQFINDKLGLTPELAQMLNQMNQNGNLVSVEKIENNHALKRLHEENAMDDESELESD